MKFSTKMIDQMAEILSTEMSGYAEALAAQGGVMAIEEEMRAVLRQVGAKGLGQVLSQHDEIKERRQALACPCGKQAAYQRKREAVVLSVFGRAQYGRSYSQRQPNEVMTIIVPQFVPGKWWENLLHNQTALMLRFGLIFKPGVVIVEVPYQV